MTLRNEAILATRSILSLFGVRLIRISPNKIRGIDPFLDLRHIVGHVRSPVIFDVGANDGETVDAFRRHFPTAVITAFEPSLQCADDLKRRYSAQSGVSVEAVALGAHNGEAFLHTFSGSRMNSLLPLSTSPDNVMRERFANVGSNHVPLRTLDSFCAERSVDHIDILKIDTQGYDLHVLEGATSLLSHRQIDAVIVEINFIPMYDGQGSFTQIHDLMCGFNYRFVDFYNKTRHGSGVSWCDACYAL
jgi:FkbM family methyltransferase